MHRQAISCRSFGRLLWLMAIPYLALTLVSCAQEQAESYRLDEAIQIGDFQLIPTHTEVSTTQPAPGPDPKFLLVVFIRCTGGNRFSRMDLREEYFDRQAIDLVDDDGRRYDFFSLGAEETHSAWEAHYYVRTESRGFRLRLENIAWREGQARRVEVPLGR